MISFSSEQLLYGQLSDDSSPANLLLGKTLCNETRRQILSSRPWGFLRKSYTFSTVASQQAYSFPSDFNWLDSLTVTISTTKYSPIEVTSLEQWNRLNMSTAVKSDIPQYYFLTNQGVELYPVPSSSISNAVTIQYGRKQKDLSLADYVTGSILTAVNGNQTITGTGTTFTASMIGRFLRITESDTANQGDGEWYEIAGYTSATVITLDSLYAGTAITAGSAPYVIGQVSLFPEAYQMIPIYKALVHYFTSVKPDQLKAKLYNDMYTNLLSEMESNDAGKSSSQVLNRGIYENAPPNINNYPVGV